MDLRMDAEAMRQNIQARLALVREGNYFELLGISPHATAYEIRSAFVTLRRYYQPQRLIGGGSADLHAEVVLIGDVLEEAYEVLRDAHRRNRYLRAIEARPAER